jgi:hypothetical protein
MSLGNRLRQIALFFVGRIARLLFHYPKIASALRTRLRGKRSFITEQIPGELSFDNGRFAIFLIWQPKKIPWYVRNALDALAEAKINTILVVNHPLTADARQFLSKQSRQILIRDNTGFDIGGYQDATNFIRDTYSIGRLLYINDSVYFFRNGLTEMLERMADSKADICTVFENWEINYHVQSFCFSLSRKVFDTQNFTNFWRKYLPVNSRLWAINHGEIELSRAIVPAVDSFEVIYTPNELRARLKDMAVPELLSLNRYLPIRIRLHDTDRRPQKVVVEDHLINQISSYSQVHTGGFLYRRFLGNPIIKRDLVYRVQYSIYDVENCLETCGHEDHLDDILSDMRRKGAGNQLPLIKKIQFMEGII